MLWTYFWHCHALYLLFSSLRDLNSHRLSKRHGRWPLVWKVLILFSVCFCRTATCLATKCPRRKATTDCSGSSTGSDLRTWTRFSRSCPCRRSGTRKAGCWGTRSPSSTCSSGSAKRITKTKINRFEARPGVNCMRQKLRRKFCHEEFLWTLFETFLHVFRMSICFLSSWEELYTQLCLLK